MRLFRLPMAIVAFPAAPAAIAAELTAGSSTIAVYAIVTSMCVLAASFVAIVDSSAETSSAPAGSLLAVLRVAALPLWVAISTLLQSVIIFAVARTAGATLPFRSAWMICLLSVPLCSALPTIVDPGVRAWEQIAHVGSDTPGVASGPYLFVIGLCLIAIALAKGFDVPRLAAAAGPLLLFGLRFVAGPLAQHMLHAR